MTVRSGYSLDREGSVAEQFLNVKQAMVETVFYTDSSRVEGLLGYSSGSR
jgi:hypothetical protein